MNGYIEKIYNHCNHIKQEFNSVRNRQHSSTVHTREKDDRKEIFPISEDICHLELVSVTQRFQAPFHPDTINVRFLTGYHLCNYACEYCIAGQHHKRPRRQNFNATRYLEIINTLTRLPFSMNIRLGVPGEFFLSPELIQGGRLLSNSDNIKHLNLITNLSFDYPQYIEYLQGYNHQKVAIVASYHPTQIRDTAQWLHTALQMNQKFDFAVIFVAYPPMLKKLPGLVNELKQEGLEVFVQGYIGQYQNQSYPSSYTAEEKSLLKTIMYSRHDYEFLINRRQPGLCNAGYKSFYVNHEGHVFSCKKGRRLGNLLQNNEMYFFNSARPCIYDFCSCDTENINTAVFEQHYIMKGINQHKYSYKFKDLSKYIPELDEWEIIY